MAGRMRFAVGAADNAKLRDVIDAQLLAEREAVERLSARLGGYRKAYDELSGWKLALGGWFILRHIAGVEADLAFAKRLLDDSERLKAEIDTGLR